MNLHSHYHHKETKRKGETHLQGTSVDSPLCQHEVSHPFGSKNMNFRGSAAVQHGKVSHGVIYFLLLSSFLDKLVGAFMAPHGQK